VSDGDVFSIALAQIQAAVKAIAAEGARLEAESRSSSLHLTNLQGSHKQLTSEIEQLRGEVKDARASINAARAQASNIIAEARQEAAVLRAEGRKGSDDMLTAVRGKAEAETAKANLVLADLEARIDARKTDLAGILADTVAAQGRLQAVRDQIKRLVSVA
jgi:chromosome segregation ATPase